MTFWSFLSTYSIFSFEKNVYQNLIFRIGSGETVEKRKRRYEKCNVHICKLELLLNFMKKKKYSTDGGVKYQKEPMIESGAERTFSLTLYVN